MIFEFDTMNLMNFQILILSNLMKFKLVISGKLKIFRDYFMLLY